MNKVLIWITAALAAIVIAGGSAFVAMHLGSRTVVKKEVIQHTAPANPAPVHKAPAKKAAAPAPKASQPNITINNNVPPAAAPAPNAQAPAQSVPSAWRNVNPGTAFFIMANSNTSDAFAWNVANAVMSNGYGTWPVYSPVTGQTYSMTAYPVTGPDGGTAVMVTGGNGAGVELYVTTANGDEPPSMP